MRHLRSVGLILVICGLFSSWVYAQYELLPGRSTDKPAIMEKKDEGPFKYESVDPEFWADITQAMDDKNFTKVVVLASDVIKQEKNSGSDEAEEAKLALAMGLSRLNISYGASVLLQELAKSRNGTKIGEAALYELNLIAQKFYYEKEDIGNDLLVSNEFAPMHSEIESFIGYHAGLYNLTSGYKDWADKEFARVKPGSYWDLQLKYLRALGEVARERSDSAITLLEELRKDESTPQDLKLKSTLQLARLKFEFGDFTTAYNHYYGLELPIREKGRVYIERAWTKFYMKDYSKALGLIAVAETPMFNSSVSYELYILKMLIFRELCHYESVVDTASEFRSKFGRAIQDIKGRRTLQKNPVIANLVLLNERFQYWSNFINQLRNEKAELADYDWDKLEFYPRIRAAYNLKDLQVQDRLERELGVASRKVALDILDAEEQVNFLDYTAKLDSLRIVRKGENRDYKSEKITYLTFEKFFWPIESEHWMDELEDYQVLIRSRCGETQLMPTKSDDEFKEFQ